MSARLDEHARRAHEVAALVLPSLRGWHLDPEVNPDYGCAEIVRSSDGARVRIRVEPWHFEGRVVFDGVWPHFADGRYHFHDAKVRVTCDLRRPESFAKTLKGRFLRAYEPEYAKALAYVHREDSRASEARLVATHIAHAIGGSVRPDGWQRTRPGDFGIETRSAVGHLIVKKAWGSQEYPEREVSVDFEVHGLAPEVAAQVLAVIRDAEQAQAPERVRVVEAEPAETPEETDEAPSLTLRAEVLR